MPHSLRPGDKGQAPTVPYAVGRGEQGDVVRLSDRRPSVAAVEQPAAPDLSHEVDQLASELSNLQARLAYLQGALDLHSPPASVVGRMGNSAEEIREEIRPLREALKDQEACDG
jgi:hypothetical protein